MASELTDGSRVKVTPTDVEQWTSDALKAFTDVEGVVELVKRDPFDHDRKIYLVKFDNPVRRWWGLSSSEPKTNPINFYSHFHFAGCDLTIIEET